MMWLAIYLVGMVCTYAYYYGDVICEEDNSFVLLIALIWPLVALLMLWFNLFINEKRR